MPRAEDPEFYGLLVKDYVVNKSTNVGNVENSQCSTAASTLPVTPPAFVRSLFNLTQFTALLRS